MGNERTVRGILDHLMVAVPLDQWLICPWRSRMLKEADANRSLPDGDTARTRGLRAKPPAVVSLPTVAPKLTAQELYMCLISRAYHTNR